MREHKKSPALLREQSKNSVTSPRSNTNIKLKLTSPFCLSGEDSPKGCNCWGTRCQGLDKCDLEWYNELEIGIE